MNHREIIMDNILKFTKNMENEYHYFLVILYINIIQKEMFELDQI